MFKPKTLRETIEFARMMDKCLSRQKNHVPLKVTIADAPSTETASEIDMERYAAEEEKEPPLQVC